MPKFKKNPNPIRYKKSSGFKMKSPLKEGWLTDIFGIKERRRRKWSKEDQEERRQQSMVGGGRQ